MSWTRVRFVRDGQMVQMFEFAHDPAYAHGFRRRFLYWFQQIQKWEPDDNYTVHISHMTE